MSTETRGRRVLPQPRLRVIRLTGVLLVGGGLAILLVWPQLLGAQRSLVVTQIVAFRAATGVALGTGALVFAVIACLRRTWGIAAGLAMVLAVSSIASGSTLAARGTSADPHGGDLTVLAWNTQNGAASVSSIARLVLDVDADIVSLPETAEHAVEQVAQLVGAQGHQMAAHTTHGETGYSELPTSVLIADRLGEYHLDAAAGSTPGLPSAVWRSVDGTGPRIVAAHPFPPLPGNMGTWRAGLQWVADQCDSSDVIVAGDLNATIDHLEGLGQGDGLVGSCRDAAQVTGNAGEGTWPVYVPQWLSTPIDHVLTGADWAAREVRIVRSFDLQGSDHRPIVAVFDKHRRGLPMRR